VRTFKAVAVARLSRKPMRRLGRRKKNKRSIWAPNLQYARRAAPHSQAPWFVAVSKRGGLRDPSPLISFKETMNIPADPRITVLLVHVVLETVRAVAPLEAQA